MKKLQNNFTTPEQSKRLLELGVPADSADLYTSLGFENLIWVRNTKNELSEDFFDALINGKSAHIPIWSVGRLIEISRICTTLPEEEYMFPFWYDTRDYIEWSIRVIESGIRTEHMDFSKLEE